MKLTRLEIQFLKNAKANKDKSLKLKDMFSKNLKKYCLQFIFISILFTLFLYLDPSYLTSAIIFGMFLGMMSRDLGLFRMLVRLNSLSLAITDWNKVDELLKN